jgi:gas vesicle protein
MDTDYGANTQATSGEAFWLGLALGAVCGAMAAWLYTPYSGAQLRTLISEQRQMLSGGVRDTITQAKDQVNNLVGQVVR